MWTKLLYPDKSNLNMYSVQFDGSHTLAKRGGEAVAYQNHKKSKTTNALFLTDREGIPLAISQEQLKVIITTFLTSKLSLQKY